MLIFFGHLMACVFALFEFLPELSPWVIVPAAAAGSYVVLRCLDRFLPAGRNEELRVKDLVLSFEAGRWVSPKAEQVADDQRPARAESKVQ
jgi:hypothetical protein